MSKEDWVKQWVKSIPGHLEEVEDFSFESPVQNEEEEVATIQDSAVDELQDEVQSWDMMQLAERGELLSREIKAVREREEELEKRVKGKRAKVNAKRDSVIMMKNVLKLKMEEVAKLRTVAAAGRHKHRLSEPVEASKSSQQLLPPAWPSRNQLSSHSSVLAGAGVRERGRWGENYLRESGDVRTEHCARVNLAEVESCVEMGRASVSLTETSREEFDQESRDWLARRHLKRENTWDAKRASANISNRSSPFKRTLSAPSVGKVEPGPEVVKLEDRSVAVPEGGSSLRRGTPHLKPDRHGSSTRCYSCHELGHFARDCAERKLTTTKLYTPRPTSSMMQIRKRSSQYGGLGGDVDCQSLREVGGRIRPSLQTSDLKKGKACQLSRSEAGQLEDATIDDDSRKKVCAPSSWLNYTMNGMIADILSKREQ